MDQIMGLLADPARRQLLECLRQGEAPAGALERAVGLSQPAVSRHLRLLREAGLVSVRAEAQRRIYRLEPAPLAALDAWLAHYRVFWTSGLDRLAAHVEREV